MATSRKSSHENGALIRHVQCLAVRQLVRTPSLNVAIKAPFS